MGSTVFTGATGKKLPSRGRSRESGKIKPSGKIFRSPSLSKELLGPFLWVLPKRILKSPSSGRSWEGEKYKDQGEIFFSGVKIDAIARFDLWTRHQNWCQTVEVLDFFFQGSETEPIIWLVRHEAPIRSQYRRRKLLSFPYRNLGASKTTFFLKKFLHLVFAAALRPTEGRSSFSPSAPLPQHWEPKNDMVGF